MSKTLLLIGGTGFFGKSILKYFHYHINSLEKRFSKIIILSRGVVKTKIDRKINEKISKNFNNFNNIYSPKKVNFKEKQKEIFQHSIKTNKNFSTFYLSDLI